MKAPFSVDNIPTIPILYDTTIWELNISMKYICSLQKLIPVDFFIFVIGYCFVCTEMDPDVTCSASLKIQIIPCLSHLFSC